MPMVAEVTRASDVPTVGAHRRMQRAAMAHPVAGTLLRAPGRNELSIAWRDRETDELCKGRLDKLTRVAAEVLNPTISGDVVCLVDLKKTARFHDFDRVEV